MSYRRGIDIEQERGIIVIRVAWGKACEKRFVTFEYLTLPH